MKKITTVKSENRAGYFVKRVFAFAVDWYFSSVLLNLFMRLVFIWTNKSDKMGNIVKHDNVTNIISIIVPLIVAFIYYVYIPYKSKRAQTLMMKAVRIEILNEDNTKPQFLTLFKRFFIGCFILQGILFSSFNVILRTILRILSIENVEKIDKIIAIPMFILIGISVIMSIRDKKRNQTLQDKIFSTYVKEIL